MNDILIYWFYSKELVILSITWALIVIIDLFSGSTAYWALILRFNEFVLVESSKIILLCFFLSTSLFKHDLLNNIVLWGFSKIPISFSSHFIEHLNVHLFLIIFNHNFRFLFINNLFLDNRSLLHISIILKNFNSIFKRLKMLSFNMIDCIILKSLNDLLFH